jgi:hypothetical protein
LGYSIPLQSLPGGGRLHPQPCCAVWRSRLRANVFIAMRVPAADEAARRSWTTQVSSAKSTESSLFRVRAGCYVASRQRSAKLPLFALRHARMSGLVTFALLPNETRSTPKRGAAVDAGISPGGVGD